MPNLRSLTGLLLKATTALSNVPCPMSGNLHGTPDATLGQGFDLGHGTLDIGQQALTVAARQSFSVRNGGSDFPTPTPGMTRC
jgi:hypothetical protein